MARAVFAAGPVVFNQNVWGRHFSDVGPLDIAAGPYGPNDEFCLEGFNADRFVKFIDQRLVYGEIKNVEIFAKN